MKNKKKNQDIKKKLMKNIGSNFILWILIIIISVSILQYLTINNNKTELCCLLISIFLINCNPSISIISVQWCRNPLWRLTKLIDILHI